MSHLDTNSQDNIGEETVFFKKIDINELGSNIVTNQKDISLDSDAVSFSSKKNNHELRTQVVLNNTSSVSSDQLDLPTTNIATTTKKAKKNKIAAKNDAHLTCDINSQEILSQINSTLCNTAQEVVSQAIYKYKSETDNIDKSRISKKMAEAPAIFEVKNIISYEFSYILKQEFDDFIILVLSPNKFNISVSSQHSTTTFLHFNEKIVSGYLLGKPFSLNIPGAETVEILIFLKDPDSEEKV